MPSPRNGTERELWQKRLQRVWKASNMTKLRAHWVSIIDEQTAKWNSLQDSAPNKAHASLTEDSQSSVVLATQQAMEDKKLLRAPNGLSDPHLSEDQGASASGTPSATTGEEEAHRSDDGEAGDDIRRVTEAIEDAGKALMEHHVYGPGSTSRTRDDDYRTPSDSDGIADDEDDVPMNTAEVPDDDSALLLDTDGRAVTAASQPPYDTSSLEARPELAEGDHIVNNSRSLTPQRYGTPDDHIRPAEQEPSPFDGLGSSYVPPTAALAYNPRTSRRGRSSLLRSSGATSEHDSRETRSPVHGNGSSEEEEEEVEERQVEDGLADDSHAAGLEGSAPSAIARGQQLRNTPRTSPLSSPPPTSSPAVNRERTRLNANVPKVPIRSVNAALGYGDSASHSNASKKRSADKPERPVKRHKGEGPDDSTIVIEISD